MSSEPFEGWAIVDSPGRSASMEIAGHAFLRLDVPAEQPVTQFYSAAAVYCITPTTEEIARGLSAHLQPHPVYRYELQPARPGDIDYDGDDSGELGADDLR